MEHIEIRSIQSRHEQAKVYEVLEAAFPEDKAFFIERLEAEPAYNPETTWIASIDGNIAASVQIFPFDIWYGKRKLSVAGIGNVATHPNYRGRGLTHQILRRMLAWMEMQKYDLSLLFTGIPSFYERMGWIPIQEAVHTIEHKSRDEEDGRAGFFEHLQIHPFTVEDKPDVRRLYKACSQRYGGARVRSESYWEQAIFRRIGTKLTALVAKRNERPVAYLLYKKEADGLFIQELCWEPQADKAVVALLERIKEQVRLVFPHQQKSMMWERHFTTRTIYKSEAMWRVITRESLAEKTGMEVGEKTDEEMIHSLFAPSTFLFWRADKF
ncbi:GNAT family N-acetyltransferase [Aneurinibacillus sp. REN35]|uniref:GNAT family N-acetyltransferase n=1 Tax=Aneurinibacillus sp. REN35 TaxID=3237286 RepID=UPI003529C78D